MRSINETRVRQRNQSSSNNRGSRINQKDPKGWCIQQTLETLHDIVLVGIDWAWLPGLLNGIITGYVPEVCLS